MLFRLRHICLGVGLCYLVTLRKLDDVEVISFEFGVKCMFSLKDI